MTRIKHDNHQPLWRLFFVFAVIVALCGVIAYRVVDLQVLDNATLQREGDARTVRNDVIVATRGNIVDRNGEPLAISTPVLSLWLNPKEVLAHPEQREQFAAAMKGIGIDAEGLIQRITANANREFLYIKRRMPPAEAQVVLDLGLKGLYSREEYKRFYPMGEAAVHLVGMTNADDLGQEGLELAYEDWLRGLPGSKQVLRDRLGRIIREVKVNNIAQPGNDLTLSIDSRLQYMAYKMLKEAVTTTQAAAGTATILDVKTGEVLGMVSQPSYNPNNRSSLNDGELPNRAMVDLLEPGSTVKTFTMTAALESGIFDTNSIIETSPGWIGVDRYTFKDPVNYGPSTLERIIYKSSQVGATRVGLALGPLPMLDVLQRVGFGESLGTGFPGEATGVLPSHDRWSKADIATLAFGYGFQVTPLQLANAYMIYASRGIRKPVSLLKVDGPVSGERVVSEDHAGKLLKMLESVVSVPLGGTGTRANIASYQVAGKTGTARYYDVARGGYDDTSHIALFAGLVPVTDPRVVIVVTIHRPKLKQDGGGAVAAPVFSQIAAGAMRILNVPPDALPPPAEELSMVQGRPGGLP